MPEPPVGRTGSSARPRRPGRSWPRGKGSMPSGRSPRTTRRSEEHTSELQSPYEVVCRLLLEKTKLTLTTLPREQPSFQRSGCQMPTTLLVLTGLTTFHGSTSVLGKFVDFFFNDTAPAAM